MKRLFPVWASVAATGAMLAALAQAGAETCTLELKRLEPLDRAQAASGEVPDHLYRDTRFLSFYMWIRPQGQVVSLPALPADVSTIFRKEPKYESEHPLRGVVKLGSHQYALALDVMPPDWQPKPSGTDREGPKPDAEAAETDPPKREPAPYHRLYFDLNHNGDLTDDGVIEAEQPLEVNFTPHVSGEPDKVGDTVHVRATLPRVDLTIDVDGAKLQYALLPRFYSRWSPDEAYTCLYLEAAAYREGQITLDGKPRHVALVDFNNNGRFDDRLEVRKTDSGRIYGGYGDVLLVDPHAKPRYSYFFVGMNTDDGRHPVSKLVAIDGRFYEVEISPLGDKLTLSPSSAPVGHVTSPSAGFSAILYNDEGCLKISAPNESEPIPLPEGNWNLLSYTIDRTRYERAENDEQARSLLEAFSSTFGRRPTPNLTLVSAWATDDCKPVKVRQGQTAALPFGPPYKPVVKVALGAGREEVTLEMSLVGSGGEVCHNVRLDRMSPKDPEFAIRTPEGDEVASGKFRWG